jgi:hypothetical protein
MQIRMPTICTPWLTRIEACAENQLPTLVALTEPWSATARMPGVWKNIEYYSLKSFGIYASFARICC